MSSPAVRDILSFSFQKTKEILFPFRFKRWLKILFIVWLAGHITGGSNFNFPTKELNDRKAPSQQQPQIPLPGSAGPNTAPADAVSNPDAPPALSGGAAVVADGGAAVFIVVTLTLLIGLPLMFLFMWLSARFNFLFLDIMTGREGGIGTSFRAHKEIGNAYFRWSLLFLLCMLGALLVIGLFVWLSVAAGGPLKVLLGIVTALLAFFVLLGIAFVAVFVSDFSLPIMYQEKLPTSAAIDRFFSLQPRFGDLAFYFLLKLGLGIAAGILGMILSLAAVLALSLAAGALVLMGFLIAGALPFLKTQLLIIGAVLLVPVAIALIVAIGLVNLPIAVFFRAFALAYLNRLIPQYNLLNFPRPQPE